MSPLRAHLAAAAHHVLVGSELLDAHWPTGMEAIGRNADLGAHAELAAVGELRGSIVQHDGAIYPLEEALRGGGIGGDDAVGVRRTISRDVADGGVDVI